MIELLIGLAIGFYGYTRLTAFEKKNQQELQALQAVKAKAATAPRHRMTIKDTEPYAGDLGFLPQFGIPVRIAQEVRVFKGPAVAGQLPFQIQDCLKQCYERGDTRGPDVAQLMAGNRPLDASEAVYFVLVRPSESNLAIVAFVDRTRA